MEIIKTALGEVHNIEPKVFGDKGGYFLRVSHSESPLKS